MDTKYSLTTLLNDLLRLQNNSYQIISKVSDLVSSKSDTIEMPVMDANGVIQSVQVPSFGAIKDQLTRLESDVKSIAGIGETESSVRLSDGSFRRILVSNFQREAADIKSMPVPISFNTKENWFFESFLNPLLYVSFNLGDQVKYNTENVEVSRYILNINSDTQKQVFNNNFLSKADIKYENFAKVLIASGITYFLDQDVVPLPPRSLRYFGNFAVTKITDDTVTEQINNVNYSKRIIRVQLDSLTYNDSQSEFLGTVSLKIGDSLIVNSGRQNTRYEIIQIESSTRTVGVRLIEGADPITIGTNIFSIYSADESPVNVNVNIGFDEYTVVFIKPIDPDSKIAAVNWSPGVGFYTSDLKTKNDVGEDIALSTYYQNEVVDFGAYLYSIAKDGVIPTSLGIEPDAPDLNLTNFKVVQVNQHLTDNSVLSDLKKLQSDKQRIQSDLNSTDKSIKELRSKIQTTQYASQQLKQTDQNQLSTLINQRDSLSSLFSSTIDDINSIGVSNSVDQLTAKYRIRGFFPMPIAKSSDRTAPQEVVQFITQYRYLSKEGGANQPEQINFLDQDGQTRRGTFSTWVEARSEVRQRKTDPVTGQITWSIEEVENADLVNINSVDIPITFGESVEFRIKSLSESGWPVSPKESDWSEIIKIEFPPEFESSPDVGSILSEAKDEKVRVELQKDFEALGIKKHVANQFEQNGKFFAHPATEISSGFLSPEQNVIALFDKLITMDLEIAKLTALLEASRGVLVVRIVDESGVEYPVQSNTTVKLFAGNYKDEVATKTVKKGTIISKNYFIKMFNDSASSLEMYARYWGNRIYKVNESWSGGTAYNSNDTDYNLTRRYDRVPLGLSNPSNDDVAAYGFIRDLPQQSSQVLGEFISSRYVSIDGKSNLYGAVSGSTSGVQSAQPQINGGTPTIASSITDLEWVNDLTIQNLITNTVTPTGATSTDFIWWGATGTTTISDVVSITDATIIANYDNTILIHIDHPAIDDWNVAANPNSSANQDVRNSMFGNLIASYNGSLYQTPLFFENTGGTGDRYSKISFDVNDQYLLGPKSVGCYLFLNPTSHSDVVVDGSDSLSVRRITFGEEQAISVPVTFQYRMTDYFGAGNVGIGNVGGIRNFSKNANLVYTKKIGIDIYSNPINKERFSFDLEVTSRYYSRTIVGADLPSRSFETALDDLNKTIKSTTPKTTRNVTPVQLRSTKGGDSNR
jgi:hypothetical protein